MIRTLTVREMKDRAGRFADAHARACEREPERHRAIAECQCACASDYRSLRQMIKRRRAVRNAQARLRRRGFRQTKRGTDWGGEYRLYQGPPCVVCGEPTIEKLDGEGCLSSDPRGVAGEHADSSLYPPDFGYPKHYPMVPACFLCMDSEPTYRAALETAGEIWNERKEGGRNA